MVRIGDTPQDSDGQNAQCISGDGDWGSCTALTSGSCEICQWGTSGGRRGRPSLKLPTELVDPTGGHEESLGLKKDSLMSAQWVSRAAIFRSKGNSQLFKKSTFFYFNLN